MVETLPYISKLIQFQVKFSFTQEEDFESTGYFFEMSLGITVTKSWIA